MVPIINARGLAKRFGAVTLFQNISLTVSEGERIGLIGPNGAGKSTLLQILNGTIDADAGEVAYRKRITTAYVAQDSRFAEGLTVRDIVEKALQGSDIPDTERDARTATTLGRAGLADPAVPTSSLSGGWRKRLAIVEGLLRRPDILLLDEPTNHLDLAGINWLEDVLAAAAFACVVVTHDRYLLENVVTDVVELNRAYADGFLRVKGSYSDFLEQKEAYLHAQDRRQESLANRVHSELEWLRRGPKARTTKAKARIEKAGEMIDELAELTSRSRTATAKIDFSATGRQTKHLIELDRVTGQIAGRTLFGPLDFVVKAGMRVGLVGPNGSGKTTLLRLLRAEIQPSAGEIRRAEHLRIVYFDQNRALDPALSLRRSLAPDGDSVLYRDRLIHVASWADRFLFRNEDLDRPVARLSGGERARVLIAQLMLQPADVLLLDEPTNDLDIPTLEILEESLSDFPGALVLVTHDRYMLDRISTVVLGLDGLGGVEVFADYSQWDAWQHEQSAIRKQSGPPAREARRPGPDSALGRRKLSYLESREFADMERRIAEAEGMLRIKQEALEDPLIASDGPRLIMLSAEIEAAQQAVDRLYARWAELEVKQQGSGSDLP